MESGTNPDPSQSTISEPSFGADHRGDRDDNSGRLSVKGSPGDADYGIKFLDWGLKIDRLFEVAYRFYKRNESKAFHPTFDERNQMNALILQARYGNFDGGRAPDIGVLDLVGKSRRNQWSMLKGMSKAEAMSKFICTLDEICPIFKAYAEAVKISSNFSKPPRDNEGNISPSNGIETSMLQIESDEQLKTIHTSLCRQTHNQFKNYAEKQFPNDPTQQKYLISSLQEQYYQQYISQMNPKFRHDNNGSQNDKANANGILSRKAEDNPSRSPKSSTMEQLSPSLKGDSNNAEYIALDLGDTEITSEFEAVCISSPQNDTSNQQSEDTEAYKLHTLNSPKEQLLSSQPQQEVLEPPKERLVNLTNPGAPAYEGPESKNMNYDNSVQLTQTSTFSSGERDIGHPQTERTDQNSEKYVDTWGCDDSSDSQASPLQPSFSEEALEPATLWTKRGVHEFRESLADDKHSGSYVINQGSLVTIHVPTFPDGRYIHFEFATEDYDIGFGLDFVFEQELVEPLSLQIREESDDDDDDDGGDDDLNVPDDMQTDIEAKNSNMPFTIDKRELFEKRRADKIRILANTIAIVPTYRRDSHQEVFVGRHKYPGRGYYVLKFDNTYSVLRSKSLFYRICYLV